MDEQAQQSSDSSNTNQPVATTTTPKRRTNVTLSFNVWWLVGFMAATILAMLLIWRPWQGVSSTNRTVTVSGSTTIEAVPDEFVFSPSWQFKGADKAAALKDASTKSDSVVAELKKLGVADKDIKTNTGGWDGYYYFDREQNQHVYMLNVTATVRDRGEAQKVQDYLVTTEPTGQVSPQATFSKSLQKKLEQQGRSEATKDARAKADEMAQNLGFTVGKVVTITDNGQSGGVYPMPALGTSAMDSSVKTLELAVQPGQNEITYTVQVVYTIR